MRDSIHFLYANSDDYSLKATTSCYLILYSEVNILWIQITTLPAFASKRNDIQIKDYVKNGLRYRSNNFYTFRKTDQSGFGVILFSNIHHAAELSCRVSSIKLQNMLAKFINTILKPATFTEH